MSATGAVWRNWAGNQRARPHRVERPADDGAVQRAVRAAGKAGLRVKPLGSGHSFTPIAVTDGVHLDLGALTGLRGVDIENRRVTLGAGTRLREIPDILRRFGLAMTNLGDIDRQTLSGAVSTGTHGTGGGFGSLSTQVVGARVVTADGELLRVSEVENAELLPAVRVGLGALGVIVDLTVQCVDAFVLHAVERPEPLEEVVDAYLERSRTADHFEFYWFPHTEVALTKTNTRLPADAEKRPLGRMARWIDDEFMANGVYRAVCALGTVAPAVIPRFNRLAQSLTGNREFTDVSPAVFTTHRGVRFREMEYALPRDAVPDALREVRRLIAARDWRVSFPVEVRSAAADDAWLSTAHGRDTGYIAVHRYHREDPHDYFAAIEDVMIGHDGRPHWGKLHTRTADGLRQVYPRFDEFTAVRDRLDPDRMFGNPYLKRVLGS